MGYKTWRNFNNLIEKAIQLINNGCECGTIIKTEAIVKIGYGAVRRIVDYELDDNAINVLKRISSYKLNKAIRLRNESVMLTLLQKYCNLKRIQFDFQFNINGYKYDCCVNGNILIEFDEQQHTISRQMIVDEKKNEVAKVFGYHLVRFDISNDIIDIIDTLDKYIQTK